MKMNDEEALLRKMGVDLHRLSQDAVAWPARLGRKEQLRGVPGCGRASPLPRFEGRVRNSDRFRWV